MSFAKRRARQEHHHQSKRQNEYHQVIVLTTVREALAHDSVPLPLRPYAETQHPYHPFTGPGCTGLSDETDSLLEEPGEQFSIDQSLSVCNSATPAQQTFSEESSILIQTIHARGGVLRAFQEVQASHVGNRTLFSSPITNTPVSNEDTFQDAEEDNL